MASNSVTKAHRLVAIGGSAGSLDVLLQLLPDWDLPQHIAGVIVLHRKADGESQLTDVLAARSPWPVTEAQDKEVISSGNIYIAPADYHLLIEADHTFSLDYSEKLNYSRPSIDATFETAALAYGPALICVLLSGANNDGTNGLAVAQAHGATILIQDPKSASAHFMPQHALDHVQHASVVAPDQLIALLQATLK